MLLFDGKNLCRTRRDSREKEDPRGPYITICILFFGNTEEQVITSLETAPLTTDNLVQQLSYLISSWL